MLQKFREKVKQLTVRKTVSVIIGIIPAVIFVVFIYYMMIHTFTGTVIDTVKETELSFYGLEELSDSFEEVLEDNFYNKNGYINLNGLTTRVLGINSLNDRQKLANGMLTDFGNNVDVTKYAEATIELNDFLHDREIDFVYMLVPVKRAFYSVEFSPGYDNNVKQSYDEMISILEKAGLNTIDMNVWFEENDWNMNDVYYKTDHHWGTAAALEAAKVTMELFDERSIAQYNREYLNTDNWTITIYENWDLGSEGKRTGSTYVGLDDFLLYVPNFETNYTYSYLKQNTTTWTYTDTILDLDYFTRKDYFVDHVYCTYMIGDYPIRITENTGATNDKRLLIMGDSFKMPYEYFLTTQFKEVYTIDLRYVSDGNTFAEYVEEFQPDIVIMCSSSVSSEKLYTFGVTEYLTALEGTDFNSPVISLGDFTVEADEDSKNVFTVVCSNLEPGQTYTLTLDSTSYSGGDGHHIQMTLQDISSNKAIVNRYFDSESNETQKWIFSIPESADTYAIYLYAGTKGTTAGTTINVKNIQLYEGIVE